MCVHTCIYIYVYTYPGFAHYSDANLCVEPKKLKTIQCLKCCIVFIIVFFISDELQDVYRCLLIFNLYNGVAGCLWLLSAKELYMILGEILALLKSLAKLPLISLGPRLNPSESIVYWLFSYCDNFFKWVKCIYFFPMWNLQLLFGFFYRTCKLQHRWEYMPQRMYRIFHWSGPWICLRKYLLK